jgi:hypothetical protein
MRIEAESTSAPAAPGKSATKAGFDHGIFSILN